MSLFGYDHMSADTLRVQKKKKVSDLQSLVMSYEPFHVGAGNCAQVLLEEQHVLLTAEPSPSMSSPNFLKITFTCVTYVRAGMRAPCESQK